MEKLFQFKVIHKTSPFIDGAITIVAKSKSAAKKIFKIYSERYEIVDIKENANY